MKNTLKTLALAFVALALFAVNATAQCGGKRIYVELPEGWGNTLYIVWSGNGNFINVGSGARKEGRWTVFTLATNLANDNGGTNGIVLANTNQDYVAGGLMYMNTNTIYSGTQMNRNDNRFTCANLRADNYIYEDPTRPGRVILGYEPPDAKYLYFLPPKEGKWLSGTPYIFAGTSGTGQKMAAVPDKCGWFQKVYFNEEPPRDVLIGNRSSLTSASIELIGLNGVGSDIPINLSQEFTDRLGGKPGDLFFMPVPEGDYEIWSTADPGVDDPERCNYKFAAVIYDSDWATGVMPCAFKDGTYQAEDYPNCSPKPSPLTATGIAKGIPKPRLVKENGISKMEYNQGKDGWNETLFTQAFRSTPGKNVQVCYDMPFYRSREGLWEFDSDKLCANGEIDPEGVCGTTIGANGSPNSGSAPWNGYMGGFFPPELNARRAAAGADYSQCPNCSASHLAEPWVPTYTTGTTAVNKWCFDRGFMSRPAVATSPQDPDGNRCGRAFGEGDFRNGDTPDVWDWGKRAVFGTGANIPQRNTAGTQAQMNELFCFESHAKFTYEKGQEFFFRGDDDIWVFINDQLVIDLGGSHLAAPGYVNLDTISNPSRLVEGEEYPIDIFFCDSRTTMSNVRISTNMYLAQELNYRITGNGDGDIDPNGKFFCYKATEDGTCAALAGGGGSTSGDEKCGPELKGIVDMEFYVINTASRDTVWLLKDGAFHPQYCAASGDPRICFGGVYIINEAAGSINHNAITTLPFTSGTTTVKMRTKPGMAFYLETTVGVINAVPGQAKVAWGTLMDEETGAVIADLGNPNGSANVVAGKPFPVHISVGDWADAENPGNTFNYVPAEGDLTFVFSAANVNNTQGARVDICSDAECTDVRNIREGFTLKEGETHTTLWFRGNYEPNDDYAFDININMPDSKAFRINFKLPTLAFTALDNPTVAGVLPVGQRTAGTKEGTGPARDRYDYIGSPQRRSIIAIDPTNNQLCETCNFDLAYNSGAVTPIPGANTVVRVLNPVLENGVANIQFQGTRPVEDPNSAFLNIFGVTEDHAKMKITWDTLIFKEILIPRVDYAEAYDRNGDGIADSLRIVYTKPFGDSLPNAIQVYWSIEDTLVFGLQPTKGTGADANKYIHNGMSAQQHREYWTTDGRTIGSITEGGETKSVITINADLSKGIQTAPMIKQGNMSGVKSWGTFREGPTTLTHASTESDIRDKVPAVITYAHYTPDTKSGCGVNQSNMCRDKIRLVFSERVQPTPALEDDPDLSKQAFQYKLWSLKGPPPPPMATSFNVYDGNHKYEDMPARITWNRGGSSPRSDGDTLVTIEYTAYRGDADSAYTPSAGDSVKFTKVGASIWGGATANFAALRDLAGNLPNPREIGAEIIGKNRFETREIKIGKVDPKQPNLFENNVRENAGEINNIYGSALEHIGTGNKPDNNSNPLFAAGDAIDILPIEQGLGKDPENVKKLYPYSVGVVLMPDIRSTIDSLEGELCSGGKCTISVDDITLNAKAYVHTNLGNYVVDRSLPPISCNDARFKINGSGNCKENATEYYLAWNLKDKKGRIAGSGAYVEVYEFNWQVKLKMSNGNESTLVFNKVNKIDMFGVRRIK